jgi:hypothetical protein
MRDIVAEHTDVTPRGRINPKTSTGRFAGATGVPFPSGKTTGNGFTYQAEIAGEICLADK